MALWQSGLCRGAIGSASVVRLSAAVKTTSKTHRRLRISFPCHCVTEWCALLGLVNPGKGGSLDHMLLKMVMRPTYSRDSCTHFMRWKRIPRRRVWTVSARPISWGSQLGICQSALLTFLTPSDSSCSKLELWYAAAYLACGRVSYGASGSSPNSSVGAMQIGQRLEVMLSIITFSRWFAKHADNLGTHFHTFSSQQTSLIPSSLLASDNRLKMELRISCVICKASNS